MRNLFFFFHLLERLIVPSFQNCWDLFTKYLSVSIKVSHKFFSFSSYEMDIRYLFYSSSSSISLIILKIVGAYLQNISMMFVVEESVLHHLFPSLFIIPSFQNLFAKYSSAFLLGYSISFFFFLDTNGYLFCSSSSSSKLYIPSFQTCWLVCKIFLEARFYDVCSLRKCFSSSSSISWKVLSFLLSKIVRAYLQNIFEDPFL